MGGAESGYIKLIDFETAKYYEPVATAGGSDSTLSAVQDATCDTYLSKMHELHLESHPS